jgi:nicotinate-nucleotide pyrophosphorylase (carboxylating)
MELTRTTLEQALVEVVARGLIEDLAEGDVTSEALFSAQERCSAALLAKAPGIVAGLAAVEAVFSAVDSDVSVELRAADGDRIESVPFDLARIEGPTRSILAGERLALNLLGRLSGVATLTRRYVEAVAGTGVAILDTRKTTPGLRLLEKEAVRAGGGVNHRFSLGDAVLVKDNHLRLARGIGEAVFRLRALTELPLEVECETAAEVEQALALGVERILLDNMSPATVARVVATVGGRAELEVSGGVTLETVRNYAETGVDAISIGALTHSAPALDVSLEVEE